MSESTERNFDTVAMAIALYEQETYAIGECFPWSTLGESAKVAERYEASCEVRAVLDELDKFDERYRGG